MKNYILEETSKTDFVREDKKYFLLKRVKGGPDTKLRLFKNFVIKWFLIVIYNDYNLSKFRLLFKKIIIRSLYELLYKSCYMLKN